jgi:hypothetical protein
MKSKKVTLRVLELITGVINSSLEPKLAYIKEQEILHEENLIDHENKIKLAAESGDSDKTDEEIEVEPRSKYTPREINTDATDGKGFAGTPLKLFPNVRQTKIDLGEECS